VAANEAALSYLALLMALLFLAGIFFDTTGVIGLVVFLPSNSWTKVWNGEPV